MIIRQKFAVACLVLALALLPLGSAIGQNAKAQALFKQAFELFQAGEFEAAALGFKEGLAIDPTSPLGHFYLAETYARQNKLDLAIPEWLRPSAGYAEFSPGELFAKGTLKGSTWEGKVSKNKDPTDQRCVGDRHHPPMKANMSSDGRTITMLEGIAVWGDIDTCRISYYLTPEEVQAGKDRQYYRKEFTRIAD